MGKERYCIYPGCNRRLITGRKYCFVHKSFGKEPKVKEKFNNERIWIGGFLLVLAMMVIWLLVEILNVALKYVQENIFQVIFILLFNGLIIFSIWYYFKKRKRDNKIKKQQEEHYHKKKKHHHKHRKKRRY